MAHASFPAAACWQCSSRAAPPHPPDSSASAASMARPAWRPSARPDYASPTAAPIAPPSPRATSARCAAQARAGRVRRRPSARARSSPKGASAYAMKGGPWRPHCVVPGGQSPNRAQSCEKLWALQSDARTRRAGLRMGLATASIVQPAHLLCSYTLCPRGLAALFRSIRILVKRPGDRSHSASNSPLLASGTQTETTMEDASGLDRR